MSTGRNNEKHTLVVMVMMPSRSGGVGVPAISEPPVTYVSSCGQMYMKFTTFASFEGTVQWPTHCSAPPAEASIARAETPCSSDTKSPPQPLALALYSLSPRT